MTYGKVNGSVAEIQRKLRGRSRTTGHDETYDRPEEKASGASRNAQRAWERRAGHNALQTAPHPVYSLPLDFRIIRRSPLLGFLERALRAQKVRIRGEPFFFSLEKRL